MTKTRTPTFPSWSDVAISLFRNDSATSANVKSDPLKRFLELIAHIPENYTVPLGEMELIALAQENAHKRKLAVSKMSEKEVKQLVSHLPMADNQFYVAGNTSATEYLWVSENAKDLMGLKTTADFTFMKICGMDDRDELYHPEDVIHIIRFGTCILLITAISEFSITPFADYYEVNFRTGWSDKEKHKTIRRQCFFSNWPEGIEGARHFDTWRVTDSHVGFHHLHWQLHFGEAKTNMLLNGMFYILNCVLLEITAQDVTLANLITHHGTKYKDVFNREVAQALALESFKYENQQTYFNQKSQLKTKIDNLIFHMTKGNTFKQSPSSTGFHFRCGQAGILGMSQELQESIWRNVT